jgi:hypothetical protein
MEGQSKGSRGLETYCKGGQGPPRAVAPSKKKKKKKSFRSHYGPGVDSASNRNEYQEYFLGVKAADA